MIDTRKHFIYTHKNNLKIQIWYWKVCSCSTTKTHSTFINTYFYTYIHKCCSFVNDSDILIHQDVTDRLFFGLLQQHILTVSPTFPMVQLDRNKVPHKTSQTCRVVNVPVCVQSSSLLPLLAYCCFFANYRRQECVFCDGSATRGEPPPPPRRPLIMFCIIPLRASSHTFAALSWCELLCVSGPFMDMIFEFGTAESNRLNTDQRETASLFHIKLLHFLL